LIAFVDARVSRDPVGELDKFGSVEIKDVEQKARALLGFVSLIILGERKAKQHNIAALSCVVRALCRLTRFWS
jgi:hypothetical protein